MLCTYIDILEQEFTRLHAKLYSALCKKKSYTREFEIQN
jgi:hypothetical protein